MTDDELNEIKARLEVYQQSGFAPLEEEFMALLAEVEQWRAIGQEFVDGTPTWEVVNDLPAPADKMWRCCYCAVTRPKGVLFQHASDCPVTQARALLEGTASHDG